MNIYKADYNWTKVSIDRAGRIFFDENFFYRGIYNYKSQICRIEKMFSSGLIDSLIEQEFILPIEITDLEFADTNEFGLILKSRKVKNVLYPTEWSYSMLLDVAKFMLRFEKELLKNGYTLHDYHPYNVIFVGTKPYHCDLGSIFKAQKNSENKCVRAMLERYYRPLYQWIRKRKNVVTNLYMFGDVGIRDEEWKRYLFGNILKEGLLHINGVICSTSQISFNRLEEKFEKLKDFSRKTDIGYFDWSHYQDEYFNSDGTIKPSARFKAVAQFLKKYEIKEITEIAANQGAFSQYCIEENILQSSLAIDYDEWAVDRMYCRLKGTIIGDKISMGVVDFVEPKSKDAFKSRSRMKNEAVLALALTHHLILSQGMSVEAVIDGICEFSEKYILVEFMPLGLYARHKSIPLSKFPREYSLENFRDILSKKCEILEEADLEINRVLFVAEKRNDYEK